MIRQLMRNKTVMAAVSIVTGIYLMIVRGNVTNQLFRIIGFALLLAAAVYLVLYFTRGRQDQVKLGYAGIAAVAGLLVLWLAPMILHLFPVLAGIVLILAGISNLTGARSQELPKQSWIGPALTIALGAVIMFHPGGVISIIVFLAGAALVLNGLSELDLIRRVW